MYYDGFSPDVLNKLAKLNVELNNEERQTVPDKKKILKLKQQILMTGLALSVEGGINYNPNRY